MADGDYPMDELVEALEDILDRHPADEQAPSASFIDGALAALLISPKPVSPDEWLATLAAGGRGQFADPADAECLSKLLRQRQAEIAELFTEGGLAFMPIYLVDEEGNPLWQIWLAGFLSVMQSDPSAWEPVFESEDEDLGAASMGLMSLAATLPGLETTLAEDEPMAIDELVDEAPMLLPYFVETIYRRRHGLERVVMDDEAGDWD